METESWPASCRRLVHRTCGWPWLGMACHGPPWPSMACNGWHGRPWLGTISHGWPCHGWPWLAMTWDQSWPTWGSTRFHKVRLPSRGGASSRGYKSSRGCKFSRGCDPSRFLFPYFRAKRFWHRALLSRKYGPQGGSFSLVVLAAAFQCRSHYFDS